MKKAIVSGLMIFSLLGTQLVSFAGEMLQNNRFDNLTSTPWELVTAEPAKASCEVKDGKFYVIVVNPGAPSQRWDVQLRHRNIKIVSGWNYTIKFTVKADKSAEIYPKVGDWKDPYFEDWNYNKRSWMPIKLMANTPFKLQENFTALHTNESGELAFHIGGAGVPAGTTFEFDDIYLECSQWNPTPPPPTPAPMGIRVNQLGYYPRFEKKATWVSSFPSPFDWALKNSSGTIVASGKTTVFGLDKDSGDFVHIIDFSNYTKEGKGYTLTAGISESYPFDIGNDIYKALPYDALKYFYHQRSGIPIDPRYTVPANGIPNNLKWARPAGHNPDKVMTDHGIQNPSWAYEHTHSLDITGGWYDLKEHRTYISGYTTHYDNSSYTSEFGKYITGGGFAVWAMQNQYELAKYQGTDAKFADGKMNIPESGNGYPDILDEARWNLECILKMQIPDGMPLAGMVHHSAVNEKALSLAAGLQGSDGIRVLMPPTTSATLNLAAVAAQGSRLWKEYDSTFADTCLKKAEIAWDAAVTNPARYKPIDLAVAGPVYTDELYVRDEFYWAACELYITTGKTKYLDFMKASTHYLEMPKQINGGEALGVTGSFDWVNTQGLGTLSLLLDKPAGVDISIAQANIRAAADYYLQIQNKQGYGITIEPGPAHGVRDSSGNPIPISEKTGYPSGSNSFVINSCMVMAYAYEITGDNKYVNGILEAMDYIMGRNPNVKSYVTGYGENSLKNPHHLFFASQYDPIYPEPPPGLICGGPNSGLEDPWVLGSGLLPYEIPPQKCYMDHVESWSTNDVSNDWNAPFAWVASFVDDKAGGMPPPLPRYTVSGYIRPDFTFDDSAAASILSGFNVEVVELGLAAKTDANGYFEIKNVRETGDAAYSASRIIAPPPPFASYVIKVSKPGYLEREVKNVKVLGETEIASKTNPLGIYVGDLNQDQAINMIDIMEIAKVFNSTGGDSRYTVDADINKDNAINMADIMIVAKHFNATSKDY